MRSFREQVRSYVHTSVFLIDLIGLNQPCTYVNWLKLALRHKYCVCVCVNLLRRHEAEDLHVLHGITCLPWVSNRAKIALHCSTAPRNETIFCYLS